MDHQPSDFLERPFRSSYGIGPSATPNEEVSSYIHSFQSVNKSPEKLRPTRISITVIRRNRETHQVAATMINNANWIIIARSALTQTIGQFLFFEF